ncbi:hypothetical protein [Flavihumibacter profundi]|uniref:hypothetical protein n=1 Tax=Flavihumibacter profundi TaxID=2716883 RepID=UPI001CC3E372|nr:hypothetical protein [Flavihumibacter profundi]MBZ5858682.1 hypothetical protein [Flavihumibacter profundi]
MNNLIRNIITVVLLLALTAQNTGKLLLVMDYYANKSVYLANCENKSRPQLHCNGQCLLMKKMHQSDKKDQQTPEKKLEWKFEVLSFKSLNNDMTYTSSRFNRHYFVPNSTGIPAGFYNAIFHPPSV